MIILCTRKYISRKMARSTSQLYRYTYRQNDLAKRHKLLWKMQHPIHFLSLKRPFPSSHRGIIQQNEEEKVPLHDPVTLSQRNRRRQSLPIAILNEKSARRQAILRLIRAWRLTNCTNILFVSSDAVDFARKRMVVARSSDTKGPPSIFES